MTDAAFRLIASGQTDVGKARARNEDSFEVVEMSEFAVVCDGMGGHAGGDVASRTAVEVVSGFIQDFAPVEPVPLVEVHDDHDRTLSNPQGDAGAVQNAMSVARSAVQLANQRIHAMNRDRGIADGRGMGTTLVGYWRVPGTTRLIAFHAGDSRLYRLRDDRLQTLTRDHSLYQIWLDNGGRGVAPQRNIIVRALGTNEQLDPELSVHSLMPHDVFLLCSDGLNGLVSDANIARILAREPRPQDACAALIDAANQAGGLDNITVVVARFAPAG